MTNVAFICAERGKYANPAVVGCTLRGVDPTKQQESQLKDYLKELEVLSMDGVSYTRMQQRKMNFIVHFKLHHGTDLSTIRSAQRKLGAGLKKAKLATDIEICTPMRPSP